MCYKPFSVVMLYTLGLILFGVFMAQEYPIPSVKHTFQRFCRVAQPDDGEERRVWSMPKLIAAILPKRQ